ncbi:hypothetical protein PHYSODRAFT_323754 [Phytophthora sojae]|uniref:Pyruvate kinase n=1 Tax=Phytophthora sojae (strain P6497) TaxID=1094619 RepID=G4YLI3_PHYSP|nr:hypothetical protein PHYSODRAFT_323754 [Phytophthora sojae]EGZ30357.1 hypothetical protein PHYSODRAFT_323754 [Phytophthora sojae]|eukprot:XP_009517632.1 hypothetical protein PHYSODRAFT_323754 [Phytophthora sojae]
MVVSRCNAVVKPANVATQMLEYTQNNLLPTRTMVSSGELVTTINMAVKEANELLLQPTYRAKFQSDLLTSAACASHGCANLHGLHGAQGDQVQARLNTAVSYVILEVYFEKPTAAR